VVQGYQHLHCDETPQSHYIGGPTKVDVVLNVIVTAKSSTVTSLRTVTEQSG